MSNDVAYLDTTNLSLSIYKKQQQKPKEAKNRAIFNAGSCQTSLFLVSTPYYSHIAIKKKE